MIIEDLLPVSRFHLPLQILTRDSHLQPAGTGVWRAPAYCPNSPAPNRINYNYISSLLLLLFFNICSSSSESLHLLAWILHQRVIKDKDLSPSGGSGVNNVQKLLIVWFLEVGQSAATSLQCFMSFYRLTDRNVWSERNMTARVEPGIEHTQWDYILPVTERVGATLVQAVSDWLGRFSFKVYTIQCTFVHPLDCPVLHLNVLFCKSVNSQHSESSSSPQELCICIIIPQVSFILAPFPLHTSVIVHVKLCWLLFRSRWCPVGVLCCKQQTGTLNELSTPPFVCTCSCIHCILLGLMKTLHYLHLNSDVHRNMCCLAVKGFWPGRQHEAPPASRIVQVRLRGYLKSTGIFYWSNPSVPHS